MSGAGSLTATVLNTDDVRADVEAVKTKGLAFTPGVTDKVWGTWASFDDPTATAGSSPSRTRRHSLDKLPGMARATFQARLRPSGRGTGGHLVRVPDHVVAALGSKGRIPVKATFNGMPYRGSIVRMGGVMMLGVTKAIMAEAGIGPGDVLDVVVENDDEPRDVDTPPELARALRKNSRAAAAWDKLSYSHRKEYVGFIDEAKKEETRARRVDQTIRALERRP